MSHRILSAVLCLCLPVLAPCYAAVVYDETIFDGVLQEREGNPVTPPLSVTVEFLDTPLPISEGTLEVVASGDFDLEGEHLNVFADGEFLGSIFQFAGDSILTTENLIVPQSVLEGVAGDGIITVLLEGTSGGLANVNVLAVESVRLTYGAVPLPGALVLLISAIGGLGAVRRFARL